MDHEETVVSHSVVFTTSHSSPLFSKEWSPLSTGSYTGTCIFLVILAIIARCLVASKAYMEQRWMYAHLKRRCVVAAGRPSETTRIETDPDANLAKLITADGVEESVKVVYRNTYEAPPWRFSVDLPRALIYVCITGVTYLLMLAVMTTNIGYFCSILGGSFLGELVVGRFIQWNEQGH
ncbi:hypothetical protein ASPVEDRAFT_137722 [Aspergillus versicolor CBS 583.65]|uniref:Copper transport protein n=1 Tax=Aspergillus versicolor CBS 583.65 TaxID=1036611 RepID=A0A1L9PTH9_ASPVE|nr:uncharacterized protein ASPVEDRAFT_137722 [Aspergillus versicolor CBS 583.65]OJJ04837.1 hypothetical protein ASPVEDRAFT_137722 [Aspergillus versicolor CBS 583.65]